MSDFFQQLFDPKPEQFLPSLLFFLGLALVMTVLALAIVALFRQVDARLLPPQRRRAVTWTGTTIAILELLQQFAAPIAGLLLARSGLFLLVYGPEAGNDKGGPGPDLTTIRMFLWGSAIAFPFTVAAVLLVVRLIHEGEPYQLGWTGHRFLHNLLLGGLAWMVVTPLILAFNLIVAECYRHWLGGPPEKHPLEWLAKSSALPVDWILLIFSAVVVAPVLEELFFRGLMLPWAARDRNADWLIMWSLVVALYQRTPGILKAVDARAWEELSAEFQPAAFALLMGAGYLHLRSWDRPRVAAVYATALLFACFHTSVWPTPVPLFLLGLALAWLAQRTQSLTAPIVLHALFNGVACVELFLAH